MSKRIARLLLLLSIVSISVSANEPVIERESQMKVKGTTNFTLVKPDDNYTYVPEKDNGGSKPTRPKEDTVVEKPKPEPKPKPKPNPPTIIDNTNKDNTNNNNTNNNTTTVVPERPTPKPKPSPSPQVPKPIPKPPTVNKEVLNDTSLGDRGNVDIEYILENDSNFNPEWSEEEIEEYIKLIERQIALTLSVKVPLRTVMAVYGEDHKVVTPRIQVVNTGTAKVEFELIGLEVTETGDIFFDWKNQEQPIKLADSIKQVGFINRRSREDLFINGDFPAIKDNKEVTVDLTLRATPVI